MTFGLWAGEPRRFFDKDASGGAGGPTSPAQGGGDPNAGGKDTFDIGYGKGVEKGKREGASLVLSELGVGDLDAAKRMIAAAREADEAARKAAEAQGQFKSLYEQEQAKAKKLEADLAEYRGRAEQYEQVQKAELATLTAKLTDERKALLEGLPLVKQIALAREFSAAATAPVGAPAGKGAAPSDGDPAKALAAYAEKGFANLTPQEREHARALQAQQRSMTVKDFAEARQRVP